MSDKIIKRAIRQYAVAYKRIQRLQEAEKSIPQGDQKTGCIGEFYSFRYLSKDHPKSRIEFGSHSEKGWDIRIVESGVKIQVKTVSAYSKTRTISPIHRGWDILHIIYLDKCFIPEGFWIIRDIGIFGNNGSLHSKKCRRPGSPRTGSSSIPFGENEVEKLLDAIND